MSKKKTSFIVCLLGTLLAVGFLLNHPVAKTLPEDLNFISKSAEPKSKVEPPPESAVLPPEHYLKKINPWDYHKPLSAGEKQEFQAVEIQVQKYLTWGKMDPEVVPAFRQTLFKMGDRAVADIARGLSQLTKDDLKEKADAEAVVRKIDELAYFASSPNPLATDSVVALATRQVSWNDSGELQNPVEANITFEMFDIFAKLRPAEATNFITTIDKKHRTAYFTHYAYGRRLAGKSLEEIDIELKAAFGSAEMALR